MHKPSQALNPQRLAGLLSLAGTHWFIDHRVYTSEMYSQITKFLIHFYKNSMSIDRAQPKGYTVIIAISRFVVIFWCKYIPRKVI